MPLFFTGIQRIFQLDFFKSVKNVTVFKEFIVANFIASSIFFFRKDIVRGSKKKTEFKDLLALATKESHCIVNDL